jgi:REP element-mobilizing transposase RayT
LALPRIVRPGRTYLVTRRCSERRFFLKPSPIVEQVYTYCLAVASERFDAEIHAFCVLSNHQHIVLTDPHGVLPRFMHWLDKSIAACLNAFYARFEPLWVPGSYSAVHLVDAEDIIDKTAYVLANPVEAGLVRQGVAPASRTRLQTTYSVTKTWEIRTTTDDPIDWNVRDGPQASRERDRLLLR